jgi:hypothetical protein
MSRPSHGLPFDRLYNIWQGVRLIRTFITQFYATSATSFLGSQIFFSALFSKTLSLCPSFKVKTKFHTRTNNRQNSSSFCIQLLFLDNKREGKKLFTEWQYALPEWQYAIARI